MNDKLQRAMLMIRRVTGIGLILGLLVLISSFFVNAHIQKFILSIGLSIMVSSMITFGFGMFISLMQEVSSGSKGLQE